MVTVPATDDKSELYKLVDAVVKQFNPEDYEKDEKQKSIIPPQPPAFCRLAMQAVT